MADLGFDLSEQWRRRLEAPGAVDVFVAAAAFRKIVTLDDGSRAIAAVRDDAFVFEGAQGLLLDENDRFFLYVTHSRTGPPNVGTLASEWGLDGIEAVYVTRAYATRHGAGPFPREIAALTCPDTTNIPNMW